MLAELGFSRYEELHAWSVREPEQFWHYMLQRLGIQFDSPPKVLLANADDPAQARWLPDAADRRKVLWDSPRRWFGFEPLAQGHPAP
jgi:hypothetical protein